MYRTIIKFKDEIPQETLISLKEICNKEHNNHAGNVPLIKDDGLNIVYEANIEDLFVALHLASGNLYDIPLFREWIEVWKYEDDNDPSENGDYLPDYLEVDEIFKRIK